MKKQLQQEMTTRITQPEIKTSTMVDNPACRVISFLDIKAALLWLSVGMLMVVKFLTSLFPHEFTTQVPSSSSA